MFFIRIHKDFIISHTGSQNCLFAENKAPGRRESAVPFFWIIIGCGITFLGFQQKEGDTRYQNGRVSPVPLPSLEGMYGFCRFRYNGCSAMLTSHRVTKRT